MHNIIVGYGYISKALKARLQEAQQRVTLYSRSIDNKEQTLCMDLDEANISPITQACDHLFYSVPPQQQGEHDARVRKFLENLQTPPKHIIYFSSSGVYGDCQGAWIDETYAANPSSDRAKRRLDAETQFTNYCHAHDCALSILRIAGIYGPERLPISAAKQQTPLIEPSQAPWINHIHRDDLVTIGLSCCQHADGTHIYNAADGDPQPMGTLQRLVAEQLNLPPAPYQSITDALACASPMRREFILSSKRLNNNKLAKIGCALNYPKLKLGISHSLHKTS